MSGHSRRKYDLDEILSEVRFELDTAFEASLRARLSEKLNTEQPSTLWSNGRHPVPNGQKKPGASLADEEERPMKNSRLLTVFAFGLTVLVAAILIGLFAIPRGGPTQPAAATAESTALPVQPVVGPTREPNLSPTSLPGEVVVADIADLVGVWRGYYAAEHTAMYKEVRADGSVVYGFQVEGSGDQIHVVPPLAGGCVDCTMSYDGSAWQLQGYDTGDEEYQDTVGRYEIRLRTNDDGLVEHTYVLVDDPYKTRVDIVTEGSPWVRIDLQRGERIVNSPSELAGIWRGYNAPEQLTMYLEYSPVGNVTAGNQVEGAGSAAHVIPAAGFECDRCSTAFDGTLWQSSGFASQDANDDNRNAIGRYELRLREGADGSAQLTHVLLEDEYQGRVEWLTAFEPFTRVDLQPAERIVANRSDLVGVWRGYNPNTITVAYLEYGADGSVSFGSQVGGTGDQLHVIPDAGYECVDCSGAFDGSVWLASGYSQADSNQAGHDGIGRYEIRLRETDDGLAELRHIMIDEPYRGRWTFHQLHQPYVRVDLQPGESITTDLSDLAGLWPLDTPDGVLYMEIGEDMTLVISRALEGEGEQAHVAPTETIAGFDGMQFLVESVVRFQGGLLRVRDTGGAWFHASASAMRGVIGAYEARVVINGDGAVRLRFAEIHDPYDGRDSLSAYGAWTRVEP